VRDAGEVTDLGRSDKPWLSVSAGAASTSVTRDRLVPKAQTCGTKYMMEWIRDINNGGHGRETKRKKGLSQNYGTL